MKPHFVLLALLLQIPTPATYSISGHVVRFADAPQTPSTLILRSFPLHEGPGKGKTVPIHADGTFEFTGVLQGECDLNFYDDRQPFQQVGQTSEGNSVSRPTAIGPGLNFTFDGHNVTGLQIKAPAGMKGLLVTEDGGSTPAVVINSTTPLTVDNSFRSARRMAAHAVAGPGGQFTLGVFPGENTISLSTPQDLSGSRPLPGGYIVKSITYGSTDVLSDGLVLTQLPTSTLVITLTRDPGR